MQELELRVAQVFQGTSKEELYETLSGVVSGTRHSLRVAMYDLLEFGLKGYGFATAAARLKRVYQIL